VTGGSVQAKPIKLPGWLQHYVLGMGGGGLFLVAFLDSSVLSFPVVTDLLVIQQSNHNPARMPYYAAMASLGSLFGCIWLYLLAKKGGEAYFRGHAKHRADRIRKWVDDHAFLSVFIPAILPPPMPFKAFVAAEGVFQVPLRTFVLALLLGRGLRYFAEGMLAIRYGDAVGRALVEHKLAFAIGFVVLCAGVVIWGRTLGAAPHKKK
jgi:membrane protein YqaA with SNARE-associated domain